MRAVLAALSSLVFAGCAQMGAAPSPQAKGQLAPTGALRVAVLTSNPIIGGKDAGGELDFSPPHLAADGFLTILVPGNSPARSMADFDRPGMRVAAVKNAAPLMILQRTLKNAQIVAADNENAAFALPKGRPAAAQYVADWVEQAKTSGAVQRAIDAAGLQGEVKVAP